MIGRRSFTFGLGSLLLGAAARAETPAALTAPAAPAAPTAPPAAAADPGHLILPGEFRVDGKVLNKKKKPKRDIPDIPIEQIPNHRQYMRDIIVELANYAKKRNPNFIVLVKNAPELLIKEKREWDWESIRDAEGAAADKFLPVGSVIRPYMRAIDGLVLDAPFVGTEAYGKATADETAAPLLAAAAAMKKEGRAVLSVDYANDKKQVADLRAKAKSKGFLEYIDSEGDKSLSHIPKGAPPSENSDVIDALSKAHNWFYLRKTHNFGTHADWIAALRDNNYDLIATDVFWRGNDSMTIPEAKTLNQKTIGTRRLVFADMSIGKAQDTRFYWKNDWGLGNPAFLKDRDPDDSSAMFLEYWADEWKQVLSRYIQGIMSYNLDGVIFSDADAYLHFEDLMPLE